MKHFFTILFLIALSVVDAGAAVPKKSAEKKPTVAELEKKRNEKDFLAAEALLYSKKSKEALPELIRLCDNGYLRACSLLGFGYYSGRYDIPQKTLDALMKILANTDEIKKKDEEAYTK